MRVAFLCKRRYMRKDVIRDRYARLYEWPRQLALRGHDVLGLCLDYRSGGAIDETHEAAPGRLRWLARDAAPLRVAGALAYPLHTLGLLRDFAPDLLLGASDSPHVVLTAWLARRLRVPYALDLYDNFESFGLTRWLGLRAAYRRAVAGADLVSCVSEPLSRFVGERYRPKGRVLTLPSTVDTTRFKVMPRDESRRRLGLPVDAELVGTAGGLHGDKGIGTLYRAFEMLRTRRGNLHLVLAGGLDPACPPPTGPRVHYLGELPQPEMATLFSALDVGVIYLRDTEFGRFCFPQKAYEMLACGLAVAAANVGVMAELFADVPDNLYQPDDAEDLAARIHRQLAAPTRRYWEIEDWAAVVGRLEPRLRALVAG